jgi:LCP family protein required for cell wall assembly
VLIVACVLAVVVASGLALVYKHLEGNIHTLDVTKHLGTDRPQQSVATGPAEPINILVMGSDTRAGLNGVGIGGNTPGLSDTTILLHISADRTFAYGVSLPRDAMVQRPWCDRKDSTGRDPGGLTQFNDAYAIGGPACTIRTVEQLADIRIEHFVVVDFHGFREMVDALHGVTVCVPEAVDDEYKHSNIHLPAGTYKVSGEQALDYVRERHAVGDGSDTGRIKRQQAFIASMVNQVVSAGTLANPVRLYKFLNALTSSVTMDEGFKDIRTLVSIGTSLKHIGPGRIRFVTVPSTPWPQNTNRSEWAPSAKRLWRQIRQDKPLGERLSGDAISAAGAPGAKPPDGETAAPSGPQSEAPSSSEAETTRKEQAAAVGLCA